MPSMSQNGRSGLPREVWRWLLGMNLPIPGLQFNILITPDE